MSDALLLHGKIDRADEVGIAVAMAATAIGMVVEVLAVSKKLVRMFPESGSMPAAAVVGSGVAPISAEPLFCRGYSEIGGVRRAGLIPLSAAAGIISYVTGGVV